LFHDRDGSKTPIRPVLIATLDAGLKLTAADIEVV
jgi:hypothetical protein